MNSDRFWLAILFLFLGTARADFQGSTHLMPFDEETIGYSKTPGAGAVDKLQAQLAKGDKTLDYDAKYGYLPAILKELDISEQSQVLVFSKTSLQRERIHPENPRALFFNDKAYVGFIPGAPMIEVTSVDPVLGAVFYTMEQTKVDRPKFTRNDQCLECHASAKTMGVPGHLVRSFETDDDGVIDLASGTSQVNHRTPFSDRWGGWYVTGEHGNQTHRGNLFGAKALKEAEKTPNYRGNLATLTEFLDARKYPAPTSDVVALMVLEHQTHMQNFIARLRFETQIALAQYGKIDHLKSKVESFLQYMLFTEEAPLTNAIKGAPEFENAFESAGAADSAGRSLRELDLSSRLFKYRCSYLVYSDAFDALQPPIKEMIYRRLHEILTAQEPPEKFRMLGAEERSAILEILRATKSGLPDYWQSVAGPAAKS